MSDDEILNLAKNMLYAGVLDWGEEPGTLYDYIPMLDENDARQLGVVFANGKCYSINSDIRGDEIEDGKVFILAKALKIALNKN